MFALFIIFFLTLVIIFKRPEKSFADGPNNLTLKTKKLWRDAQEALIDRKYLRAERILLTILRIDERNAMAYNRLGIIYAGQKNFDEAIECFEIAQSLESSASSLHNVGLIYLETKNYEKAALAFEQALELESDMANRHIAYSKALQHLGKFKAAAMALEKAVELDPRPQTLRSLGQLHLKNNNIEKAQQVKERLDEILMSRQTIKQNRIESESSRKVV